MHNNEKRVNRKHCQTLYSRLFLDKTQFGIVSCSLFCHIIAIAFIPFYLINVIFSHIYSRIYFFLIPSNIFTFIRRLYPPVSCRLRLLDVCRLLEPHSRRTTQPRTLHRAFVRFLAPLSVSQSYTCFSSVSVNECCLQCYVLYNGIYCDCVFKSDCLSHFAPQRNVASHRCFPLIYSSFFFARPLF